jgi:hypothetical protein
MVSAPTLPGVSDGSNYVLSASVDVHVPPSDTGAVSVACTLQLDGMGYDSTFQNPGNTGGEDVEGTLALDLTSTITAPEAPDLSCKLNSGSDHATMEQAALTVIAVDTLQTFPCGFHQPTAPRPGRVRNRC